MQGTGVVLLDDEPGTLATRLGRRPVAGRRLGRRREVALGPVPGEGRFLRPLARTASDPQPSSLPMTAASAADNSGWANT